MTSVLGMHLNRKKRLRILQKIAETGSAIKAASEAGCTFQAIYWRRQHDKEFGEGFALAMAEYQNKLEEECDRRAYDGIDHPVTYEGEITATYKEYSDVLLMFRLKAIAPQMYRENTKIEHTGAGGGPIVTKSVAGFDFELYGKLLGAVAGGAGNGAGILTPNGTHEHVHPAQSNGETGGVS